MTTSFLLPISICIACVSLVISVGKYIWKDIRPLESLDAGSGESAEVARSTGTQEQAEDAVVLDRGYLQFIQPTKKKIIIGCLISLCVFGYLFDHIQTANWNERNANLALWDTTAQEKLAITVDRAIKNSEIQCSGNSTMCYAVYDLPPELTTKKLLFNQDAIIEFNTFREYDKDNYKLVADVMGNIRSGYSKEGKQANPPKGTEGIVPSREFTPLRAVVYKPHFLAGIPDIEIILQDEYGFRYKAEYGSINSVAQNKGAVPFKAFHEGSYTLVSRNPEK
jgi:hypothetical protein